MAPAMTTPESATVSHKTSTPEARDRWWSIRSVPARLIVFFVTLLAVDVLYQLVAKVLHAPSSRPLAGMSAIVSAVVLSAVMIVAYRLLVRWIENRRVEELGRKQAARLALIGVVCGAVLFTAVEMILVWKGVAHIGRGAGTTYLSFAIGGALAAAVGEEIVFRGAVFRIIEEGFGTLIALLLSAALFGALHGFNPGASPTSMAAIALEAGILLGAAYTATRSLWLPIGLHFGWNFAEGGIFGAAVSGNTAHGVVASTFSGDPLWTGGAFGPEASVVAVIVCLIASVVFLAIAIRRGNWRSLRFRMLVSRTAVPGAISTA